LGSDLDIIAFQVLYCVY